MACYAALTSLLQSLELIPQPPQPITYLQCRCEHLCRLLRAIDDSPIKRSTSLKLLEGRIRDASYEAEDIVQSQMSTEVVPPEMTTSVEYMPPDMEMDFQGIEKIIDEFDSILDEICRDIWGVDLASGNTSATCSSRSVAGEKSTPVGLDEPLLKIKDWLTGLTKQLTVISLVGMGGIGKTTLATNLYHDSLIQHHFDCRAWILVSQEYHLGEILTGLVNSTGHAGDGKLHKKKIQEIGVDLHKTLKGRRYLIVMDDVWDTKVWDDVRRFFPDDNNGSRIILTTRLSNVATYANSSYINHMELLSSETGWDLLRQKVFAKERCPLELEEIGKKIAQYCNGLPLAIVVISGLLSKGTRTSRYWNSVAESVESVITGNDDHFVEILSLSYNSLPHHLKPCFLYIGVFPKGDIKVSKLIDLWIVEGFVKSEVHKSLENVAEEYLNDLIAKNLIMGNERDHNGRVIYCGIHDLWRELCVKKAQDEKFFQIVNSNFINGQPRVSIRMDILDCIYGSSIRSFMCSNVTDGVPMPFQKFLPIAKSCRLLKVWDSSTIQFPEFPIEIVMLFHLRYLALRFKDKYPLNSKIGIPASISKLQNLQTLFLYSYEELYLPSSIWEMPQLRHILCQHRFVAPITRTCGTHHIALENLQKLSGITNLRCSKEILGMIPNLKKLNIIYVDQRNKWPTYELNNLVFLHQLESLECRFIEKAEQKVGQETEEVSFAFPPSLKTLQLSGCRISWEKLTVAGSLPNLEVLELHQHACVGNTWEPNEGEFSELKVLRIFRSNLEHWKACDTHFPRLQHLRLSYCQKLVEIPSEIGEIPTLEMLEVNSCSGSAVESAKLIKEEQQSLEINTLTVVCSGAALKNLQTLSGITNLRCSKEILGMMPNLKNLDINYDDQRKEWSTYELNNLVYLHQLESLKCRFVKKVGQQTEELNFAFPPSLKTLYLSGCEISWEELTVVGSLPNLEVLELHEYACVGDTWEPNEGEFSELKVLRIDGSNLEYWMASDIHFPRLQHLSLRYCYKLVEIPSEIGDIPTLEILAVHRCSSSAVESAKLIKEEQQSLGNDTLTVWTP